MQTCQTLNQRCILRCLQDCFGHGTHVSGIAGGLTYGVAKNVTLVAGTGLTAKCSAHHGMLTEVQGRTLQHDYERPCRLAALLVPG